MIHQKAIFEMIEKIYRKSISNTIDTTRKEYSKTVDRIESSIPKIFRIVQDLNQKRYEEVISGRKSFESFVRSEHSKTINQMRVGFTKALEVLRTQQNVIAEGLSKKDKKISSLEGENLQLLECNLDVKRQLNAVNKEKVELLTQKKELNNLIAQKEKESEEMALKYLQRLREVVEEKKRIENNLRMCNTQGAALREMLKLKEASNEQMRRVIKERDCSIRIQQEDFKSLKCHRDVLDVLERELSSEVSRLTKELKNANFMRLNAEKALEPVIAKLECVTPQLERKNGEVFLVRELLREKLIKFFKLKEKLDLGNKKNSLLQGTIKELCVKLNISKERNDKLSRIIVQFRKDKSEIKKQIINNEHHIDNGERFEKDKAKLKSRYNDMRMRMLEERREKNAYKTQIKLLERKSNMTIENILKKFEKNEKENESLKGIEEDLKEKPVDSKKKKKIVKAKKKVVGMRRKKVLRLKFRNVKYMEKKKKTTGSSMVTSTSSGPMREVGEKKSMKMKDFLGNFGKKVDLKRKKKRKISKVTRIL